MSTIYGPPVYYGGCQPWGPHGAVPYQQNYNSYHQNMPDTTTGAKEGWLFQRDVPGYGVDLNNNGRYDRGQDAVIGFDLDHNGRVDKNEVKESNERMKAFGGNYDLNGDGNVNFCERIKGQRYQREMQQKDTNHDGRLDANELSNAGGRVMVDHNRDGNFQPNEQYSPYNFPTPGFGQGSINYVDPRGGGHSSVNNTRYGWAYF